MLSVIIPVGSARVANLYLVLASLAAQTLPKDRWEVVVVNDGNADTDYWSICRAYPELDLSYVYQPKHVPGHGTMQPRNRGARHARYPFYVFADSDVILRSDVLEIYAQDLTENPDRVIAGRYDWLPPMRISRTDIEQRFDDILAKKLRTLPIPQPQTHNIADDMRVSLFGEQSPRHVYRATTPQERLQLYPKFLATFSGNLVVPARIFWEVGGFWDELIAGAHEDGTFGLSLLCRGFGLSFDGRARGGHLYHSRDIEFIKQAWQREIPLINRRFHLEDWADEEGPRDSLPSLQTMSQAALKAWGVADWQRLGLGQDNESGFRGF